MLEGQEERTSLDLFFPLWNELEIHAGVKAAVKEA